jgi:hypothetical protein
MLARYISRLNNKARKRITVSLKANLNAPRGKTVRTRSVDKFGAFTVSFRNQWKNKLFFILLKREK